MSWKSDHPQCDSWGKY